MTRPPKNRALFLLAAGLYLALAIYPAQADQSDVFGTALGAGVGGFVVNQFGHGSGNVAATLGGVVLGGYAGEEISHSFHRPPSYGTPAAYYDYPAPINTTYVPNYVAPAAPVPPPSPIYTDTTGDYCREYSETVRIGNRIEESYGTACLQPDGSWRVVQ